MPRTRKPVTMLIVFIVLTLALTACAAGANTVAQTGPPPIAGFWPGAWHGLICPVTFVISLFNDDVGVYEVRNSGGWYDFGFLFGAMVVFSSGGHAGGMARSGSGRS